MLHSIKLIKITLFVNFAFIFLNVYYIFFNKDIFEIEYQSFMLNQYRIFFYYFFQKVIESLYNMHFLFNLTNDVEFKGVHKVHFNTIHKYVLEYFP